MTKEEWQAIKTKDKRADGRFYYAVKRSKIVCRPSCGRRTCEAKDVIIFRTLEEALDQGYRVCSQCRPDQKEWNGARFELAKAAEDLVREHYKEKFSLDTIADTLHVDKSYLLRTFKEMKGTTLLSFHNRMRCEAAGALLERPELSISYISSEVGFVSPSHFSQIFRKYTGESPSAYRARYLEELETS